MSGARHDVACVLVNYNSGWLCAEAVRSLRAQEFEGKGGAGSLQIVVVDNASPDDQHPALDPLRELDVEVIYHDENAGYGRGMNLGMNRVRARRVLLSNPDVIVLPGALQALVERLDRDPRVGAVGPRGYLDAARFILLPPNDLPSLGLHVAESLGRVHRWIARRAAERRTRRYLAAWQAKEAFDAAMISGFAMFLPADLARRLGPFDPHYPFYFEDADLCRRVRRAGFRLSIEPRAEMIHFFDQSARQFRAEVERKYHASRRRYYRKHYGRLGYALFERMERYAARRAEGGQGWRFFEPEDLGRLGAEPLRLDLPKGEDWVMEIATDPAFLFCGGHLGSGAELPFPRATWDFLEAIRWYVRVLDRQTLLPIRYVTFEKTAPSGGPVGFDRVLAEAGGGGT